MENSNTKAPVKLKCGKDIIEVQYEVAIQSRLIREVIEDGVEDEIPISFMTPTILKKILVYCEHYKDCKEEDLPKIEKPLKDDSLEKSVPKFDYDYIIRTADWKFLFDLTHASTYLGVAPLTELCCAYIASKLREIRTPRKLRKEFGVNQCLSPEEERKIRLENQWVELADFEEQKN